MSHITDLRHRGTVSRIQKQVMPQGDTFICSFILRATSPQKLLHSCRRPVFFSGVAEQFAIAEAKLRAWASIDDGDDEDSNDEDSFTNGQTCTSFSQSSGIQPFCLFSCHSTHRLHRFIITKKKKTPHLPNSHPNYPFIPRCSDFLLLPQTTPRPILSQERHVSLRSAAAARHHPLTVPWVPAAVCSVVGRLLTMTRIHPRPVHPLYPTTA